MSKNSVTSATGVQAQEMCRHFIKLIRKNYPQLKRVRFIGMNPKIYQFRANYKKRQLWAWGTNPEYAISRFMMEISGKVFQEKYYETEEFKKIKDQLQRRVIFQYSIKELPAG